MNDFVDMVDHDQRLRILRALNADADYSHNEHIIRKILGAFGHRLSLDYLRTQLNWLAEQRLLTIDIVADLWVAKLTARGADVAQGSAVVPGVSRPLPGE